MINWINKLSTFFTARKKIPDLGKMDISSFALGCGVVPIGPVRFVQPNWSSTDWSSAFGPARLVQCFLSSGLYCLTLTSICKLTLISAYFINMNELNNNIADDVIDDEFIDPDLLSYSTSTRGGEQLIKLNRNSLTLNGDYKVIRIMLCVVVFLGYNLLGWILLCNKTMMSNGLESIINLTAILSQHPYRINEEHVAYLVEERERGNMDTLHFLNCIYRRIGD